MTKAKKLAPELARRAVGYVRVSTAQQVAEGISLEHQADAIREHCAARGLELVSMVVEAGHSAYSQPLSRRVEGRWVTEMVRRHEVGTVVALRLDRLFRSIADCVGTVQAWDRAGVALHLISLGGQAVDTGSAMGRAMLALMAAFGEMESEVKAERTVDAWDFKRARGERLGSVPPFGYRQTATGHVETHDAERAVVARIMGRRSEGYPVAAIVRELDAEGIPARGSRWYATTVRRIVAAEQVRAQEKEQI